MYKIYRLITFLLTPIILINIYIKILKNKEDKKRVSERFGLSKIKKPNNKEVIWIHAASVGEFKSCDFLINHYHKLYCLLITTTTKTAADYALKKYGNKIIHQYAPFDIVKWVNNFINNWKPKLVIWIESDLWPNTLFNIKKNNIKSIFLNGRISPKSFKQWKIFSYFYKTILSTFSHIYAQSIDDQNRMKILSNLKVEYIGNLKLTLKKDSNIFKKTNDQITIMVASTHKEEDEMIIPYVIKILNEFKDIKFYIAPRHLQRSKIIYDLLKKNKVNVEFESKLNKKNEMSFVVIDSFGKVENYFIQSDIVILGGSFTKNGGHNPIEPARANCALLAGQYVYNWKNLYDEMNNSKACYILNKPYEIEIYLKKLIKNKKLLENMKKNAFDFSKQNFFDEIKLVDTINRNLKYHA